jgi:hypothetical protein
VSRTPRQGYAPVVFDELSFSQDLVRMSASAAKVARAARRRYEEKGVPLDELRACEVEGPDMTLLPRCLKIYLPQPAGRFGMVFRMVIGQKRSHLRYVAFGVRHQPRDSHAPTVYQLAHRRLHETPSSKR